MKTNKDYNGIGWGWILILIVIMIAFPPSIGVITIILIMAIFRIPKCFWDWVAQCKSKKGGDINGTSERN